MDEWTVDAEEIQRLLQDLVAIPSVNPAFPGGTGEAAVAEYVRDYMKQHGIAVMEQSVAPGRSNIVGMWPGASDQPALLLEAHMDTVQAGGMTIPPFAAEIREGRLYGRGACDTKASLAAMLAVMGKLAESDKSGKDGRGGCGGENGKGEDGEGGKSEDGENGKGEYGEGGKSEYGENGKGEYGEGGKSEEGKRDKGEHDICERGEGDKGEHVICERGEGGKSEEGKREKCCNGSEGDKSGTYGRSLPFAVHLAAVVDEEYEYKGVLKLAEAIAARELNYFAAVVGEPTGLNRVIAHNGCVRFEVETLGVAGHSSQPDQGVNAIEVMTQVLAYLQQSVGPSLAGKRHPLVGAPTYCITRITGGEAPNTIPGHCRITIDRRTVPGEDPWQVWSEIREQLESWAQRTAGLQLRVHKPFIVDDAMETPANTPLTAALARAVARVGKAETVELGATYGTDASKLARVGVPTVVFGPGNIAQAHTEDEWVQLDEVVAAANALLAMIANLATQNGHMLLDQSSTS